ncbi:MAG: glycosyltransferase [Bacilli bacterium]|nr:glycosyltransferase [Bacilli bacterium]
MKNNYISIIVPIYNAEKYLNKCIDSLLNQTKKELEIILINDGSTDNSEKIIKSYNDKRIIYYKNKNQGIGKTRNFGIEKATGKYIMFVDSDDYLKEDACEKLYKKAEKENLDLVICNFYRVVNNENIEENLPYFQNASLKENSNILLDVNLAPWNKLYKTTLIKNNNIRFIENLKYEDAPFVVETIDKAEKIGKIQDYLNYYVIHDNSETTIRDEKVFDILEIIDKIYNYFKDNKNIQKTLETLIVSMIANYNIQQRVQIDKDTANKFIDESFDYLRKHYPNYKKNSYFKKQNLFRRLIEKNKRLTKLYCSIYRLKSKKI